MQDRHLNDRLLFCNGGQAPACLFFLLEEAWEGR